MTNSLSADELASFRLIAGMMIPASAKHGVPGADDEAIFADITRSFGRDAALVKQALGHLHTLGGGPFARLDDGQRAAVATDFRKSGGIALMRLSNIILQCYYRDDRVMRSLGMEPRPPFPKGFEVEQGDWSMLEKVRARGKIWRDAPG
jgi:hypothetical protein